MWAGLGWFERAAVASLRLRNLHPPTFIVGPPRSGTTAVYLLLANSLRMSFIPQFARQHPNAPVIAATFARAKFGYTPTFRNDHGHVLGGPGAPSDGWEVFHRWFPRYDLSEAVRTKRLHELRTIVRCLENIYGGPFVNKNNNHGPRVSYLAELFPDALFIHVERDLYANVRSLLEARRANEVAANEWWSTVPPNLWREPFSRELERCVATVWDTNRDLREQLGQLEETRSIHLPYERTMQRPVQLLDQLGAWYRSRGVDLRRRPGWSARLAASVSASTREVDSQWQRDIDEVVGRLERAGP